MPQLQNLVLTDRAATPVAHTFTPREINNGLGTVVETSGTAVGENRVQVALNRTTSGKLKGVLKMAFPVVQTSDVNGITSPVVVRTAYVNLDVTFDATSTELERNNVIGMLQSALDPSKTLVNDALIKLQGVY